MSDERPSAPRGGVTVSHERYGPEVRELLGAARDVCTGHISVDKLVRLRRAVLAIRPEAFGA